MGTHYSIPHDCDDEKPNGKVEFQEAEECQHAVHTQLRVQLCDQQLHEGVNASAWKASARQDGVKRMATNYANYFGCWVEHGRELIFGGHTRRSSFKMET